MQRLSRIGRNTLAVSVSTLLLSACNQGDDAPKPAAVAPQPAAPSMAALSIPLCLNGQCAVIDQDAKLLVPFDNDYDNIVASAYQGTLMAAREERWNLIQAKDGKVLRDDIGEALSLLTPTSMASSATASTAWSTARASPGAAFRRHLPQQCQRIHHLRDRWQARHP